MKYLYLAKNAAQLEQYEAIAMGLKKQMEPFLSILQKSYDVTELPRCVILCDLDTATKSISDIPIPAYTNDYRTIFCPDIAVWKEIYLRQLDGYNNPEIQKYYETMLSDNHILQILGHEFVHHSNWFLDGSETWFEEGMCEYISRKNFLTEEEFSEEARTNALLVQQYQEKHGTLSLEEFGQNTYQSDFSRIFSFYWKSFLVVQELVDRHHGDIAAVFATYHQWSANPNGKTLIQFLDI